MSEKVEIRLKVPKWISDALKEYCDHFGATPVSTITPLLVEYLWHPSRVRVIPPECISNIYSSVSTNRGNSHSNPKKKKGSRAKGKGHTQADWNATFRNACRGWIKERMPRPEPKLKEL